MLYNFLWDDVARKQLQVSKQNQNQDPESMELVDSPTTALPRPVTIYADHGLKEPKRDSASSKMNFRFPFSGDPLGSHSPALSQEPSTRFSQVATNRLTM
jgi:hypothetical protein